MWLKLLFCHNLHLNYTVTKGSCLHLAAGGKKFEKKNAACGE